MDKRVIEFKAQDGQQLERITPLNEYASDTINYIEARFDLCDAWKEYPELFAVWYTDVMQKSSAINADGVTVIPAEILTKPGTLIVNLCANYVENGILKARLTSYPVPVLKLKKTRL